MTKSPGAPAFLDKMAKTAKTNTRNPGLRYNFALPGILTLARIWLIRVRLNVDGVSRSGENLPHSAKLKKYGAFVFAAFASLTASGCLMGGGSLTNLPEAELAEVNLQIRLGRVDTEAPASGGVPTGKLSAEIDSLGHIDSAEGIQLRNMVLRFTSNLRDTVWDTLTAASNPALAGVFMQEDRAVSVDVALRPLRWWNIEIKTHDTNDSIIHHATVGPIPSRGGQSVFLDVPLIKSRYSLYEARYVLPEYVYPANVPEGQRTYQKIFFHRLVLSIDSTVVRDSNSLALPLTAPGTRFITPGAALRGAEGAYFFRPSRAHPDTITHIQSYRYVRAGPRFFNIKAYGHLEGDSVGQPERLLFEGSRTVTIVEGATTPELPIILDWRGPGSGSGSTNPQPGDPDWSGVTMRVILGKARKVTLDLEVGGSIP